MEIKIWEEIDDFGEVVYKAKVVVVYDNINKSFENIDLEKIIQNVEEHIRETYTV